MTGCNATLTTATVEPCPRGDHLPCFHDCNGTRHVELHTLTCGWSHDSDEAHCTESGDDDVWWYDAAPGATPHTPTSTVTDAEVEAAVRAWEETQDNYDSPHADIRRALEAAARVRAAQENDQ